MSHWVRNTAEVSDSAELVPVSSNTSEVSDSAKLVLVSSNTAEVSDSAKLVPVSSNIAEVSDSADPAPMATAAGHVLHASASTSHVPPVLDNDLHLLSQPPRRVIMPAVDIEQPVSADDPYGLQDYVDLGLDGDGLGTDDFAGNDVGQYPALHNFSSEPGAAPSAARKPLPAWFTDLVAQKLEFLRQKDSQNCPQLYSEHGTFWLPRKCVWFNMLQSKTIDAAQLYNPRFFYWDPLYLVKIQCPEKGCTAQLTRHGGIHKHPHRTVDLTG